MKIYRHEMLRGEIAARDLPEDLYNEYSVQDVFSLAVKSITPEHELDPEILVYVLVDRYSHKPEYSFYNWDDLVSFLRSYFNELHRFDDFDD